MTFIDEIKITVEAGKGGNGCVSFRREKFVPKGGPNGGDGGHGGSVYLFADDSITTLFDLRYKKLYRAGAGKPGEGSNCHGRNGEDLVLSVPVGTCVYADHEPVPLWDLVTPGERVQVAKGGMGGLGNARFKTSTNRAPRQSTPGDPGEALVIRLELKLLADIGLVGLPNAGKSSLITALTKAKPKIASYPFTTLSPHLGVLETSDYRRFVLADIPGLVDGASKGVGLGLRFLKHISRCRMLLHVIDVSGHTSFADIKERFEQVRHELRQYSHDLSDKTNLVVLNKIDLLPEETTKNLLKVFDDYLQSEQQYALPSHDEHVEKKVKSPLVVAVSAYAHMHTQDLINTISRML